MRLQADLAALTRAIEHDALREVGVSGLDAWSAELQGGDPLVDGQIFREFTAFHLPWKNYPSLAARYQEKVRSPGELAFLAAVAGEPYSVWEIGDGTVRDLFRGLKGAILAHPLLESSRGRCLYAKVLEQDGQRALLSAYPVALPKGSAEKLVRELGVKGKVVSTEALLHPRQAAKLYRLWRERAEGAVSEVGRRATERGVEVEPTLKQLVCRDVYSFDPKKRSWLLNAFDAAGDLQRHQVGLYHYPAKGDVQGVVQLEDGKLVAHSFSPAIRDALERIVAESSGPLLSFEKRHQTNLLDHILEFGVDQPILPGMPSVAQMMTVEQRAELEATVAQLRAAGFGQEEQLNVSGLVSAFLCHREQTVAPATLRRDVSSMSMLETFLDQHGWALLQMEPDGPFNDSFQGQVLPGLVAPFLHFARLTEHIHGTTRTKAIFTTIKLFARWLDQTGRLREDDRDALLGALEEYG